MDEEGMIDVPIKMLRPTYRKPLGKRAKEDILARQRNLCFYCQLPFGSFFTHKSKLKAVAVGWDHLLPFSYSFNSQKENTVASCYPCNAIKGSRVFDTAEQAISYVRNQRTKKGLPNGNAI